MPNLYTTRHKKRDANEAELARYMTQAGIESWPVSIGDFPDRVCCYTKRGIWFPVEIKQLTGKKNPRPKPLTFGQKVFFDLCRQWNAPCYRISTKDEIDVMIIDLESRCANTA